MLYIGDDDDDMISVDSCNSSTTYQSLSATLDAGLITTTCDNSDSNYDKILKEIGHELNRTIVLSNEIQPLFSKLEKIVYKSCTERARRIVTIIINYIRLDCELKDANLVAVKELFKELLGLIYKDMQDTASDSPIESQLHHLCHNALTLNREELCDKLRHLSLSFEKIREDIILESDKLSLVAQTERKKLEDQLDKNFDQKIMTRLLQITSKGCVRTLQISRLNIMRLDVENLVFLIRYQNASIDTIQELLIKLTKFYFNDYKKRN
jgi:hypothetical protein